MTIPPDQIAMRRTPLIGRALALALAFGLAAAGGVRATAQDTRPDPDGAAPIDPADPFGDADAFGDDADPLDPFMQAAPPEDDFRDTIQGERAVLRGLNKVTAATQDFTVEFDEPLQFGSLTVITRACSKRPPEFIPETFVFLEIYDLSFDGGGSSEYGQKIFSGWMLGSSPALHGLEHPVYDIWPVGCETPPQEPDPTPPTAGDTGEEVNAAASEAASDPGSEIFED